jgi:hypothetical protein
LTFSGEQIFDEVALVFLVKLPQGQGRWVAVEAEQFVDKMFRQRAIVEIGDGEVRGFGGNSAVSVRGLFDEGEVDFVHVLHLLQFGRGTAPAGGAARFPAVVKTGLFSLL